MTVYAALLPCSFGQEFRIRTGRPQAVSPEFGLPPLSPGLPPVTPIPPLGLTAPRNFRHQNRAGRGLGGFRAAWPFLWGDYGGGYEATPNEPSPGVVIVMPESQGAAQVVAPQPPAPVRPEIHEYGHTEQSGQSAAAFTIVGSDGHSYTAAAVWVQDNTLHFITPDGTGRTLPLTSVNRDATRAANARDGLTLRLPAPAGS